MLRGVVVVPAMVAAAPLAGCCPGWSPVEMCVAVSGAGTEDRGGNISNGFEVVPSNVRQHGGRTIRSSDT
jgi:hypothetical protein